MITRGTALLLVGLTIVPSVAVAGAWTQPEGGTELIAGITYSRAVFGFDHTGKAGVSLRYEKLLAQLHAEYGWNDWLTFIVAPEYAHARLAAPRRAPELANDPAIEAGARVRLLRDFGTFAAQLTAQSAGAFDMTVSADGAPGRQLELRLLYGTNFTLFGQPGFFDAEVAQRWIAGPRADEVPIDLTLGLRVTERTRVLVQSFNIIAQGNASPPYSFYRSHKLALSVVTDIRPGLCLQSGGYVVPAGQNALAEQGVIVNLWVRF